MKKIILTIILLISAFSFIMAAQNEAETARHYADAIVRCLFFNQCTKLSMESELSLSAQADLSKKVRQYGKVKDFRAVYYEKTGQAFYIYYMCRQEKGWFNLSMKLDKIRYDFYVASDVKLLDAETALPRTVSPFKSRSKELKYEVYQPIKAETYGLEVVNTVPVKNGKKNIGSVRLAWKCGKKLSYNVYVSSSPGRGYNKDNKDAIKECGYKVTNLIYGKKYYFVITSVEGKNPPVESPFSAEVSGLAQ